MRVTLQGLQRVESVTISEEARNDASILEDLVAAAINDALERARAATQETALGLFKQLNQE